MPEEVYDIVVLGGGIAGAAAAGFAARYGRRTCLVSRDSTSHTVSGAEVLHPKAAAILTELGIRSYDQSVGQIANLTFWSADFSLHAECTNVNQTGVAGRQALRTALSGAARNAGAEFVTDCTIVSVAAGEDAVLLTAADGRVIAGRVLIAADGVHSISVRCLRLPPIAAAASFTCAEWRGPARKAKRGARGAAASLHVALATQGPLGFCMVLADAHAATVRLSEPGTSSATTARLREHLSRLAALPEPLGGMDFSSGETHTRAVPRGAALEFETHVGKRTLVIGEAGGFVSALSQDGLYPSLAAARIAARIAHEALDARHTQDELCRFDAAWRGELAEHLRVPGTDLKFLVPLVFRNPVIAERMARAFLLGENL